MKRTSLVKSNRKAGYTRAAAAALAAFTALASGSLTALADEAQTEGSQDLQQIDVVLDWYPNAIHTFLYEAIDKGYFASEGLEVNLISPAESVDALTFVSTGRAAIGLTYPIEVIESAETDLSVRAIGAVTQDSLSGFTTLADTGITSDFSTVKGKKIGYDGTASSEAMVRTAMSSAGLSEEDYELIDVGFDLTTALTTGSVDLTSGMMVNDEVVTIEHAGYDVQFFPYSDYGVPAMYDIVMVANDEAYQADPDLYNGFLRACYKGFQDMKASEDESLEIIMTEMNTEDNPLDEDQQKESYETLLPYMEMDGVPFLTMTEEKWQNFIDWMKQSGLIESDIAPSDIMTPPDVAE